MIVRRLAARGLARTGSTEEDPRRKRAAKYLLIIFSAGAISGVAALIGLGPFGDLRALINGWVYGGPGQITASSVFPAVQPTHKTVNVYDPPPPARSTSRPTSPATSNPQASPSPRRTFSPRPTPSPDN
jgi:hypothetical protein